MKAIKHRIFDPINALFFLSFVAYFPIDTFRLTGSDFFSFLWLAQAYNSPDKTRILIHPLSYVGLYPFSHYPVWFPQIFGFLLRYFPLVSLVIAYDVLTNLIVFSKGSQVLEKFHSDKTTKIIGLSLLMLLPGLAKLNHFSVSLRIPVIICQLFIFDAILEKSNNPSKSYKPLVIESTVSILAGLLFHRLAIMLVFYPLSFVFLNKASPHVKTYIQKRPKISKSTKLVFLSIYALSFIIGTFVLDLYRVAVINIPWLDLSNPVTLIIAIFIDITLRLGFIVPLSFLGLYFIFVKPIDLTRLDMTMEEYLATIMIAVFLGTSKTLYAVIVFLAPFWLLAIVGIKHISQSTYRLKLFSLILSFSSVLFFIAYSNLISNLFVGVLQTIFLALLIFVVGLSTSIGFRKANRTVLFFSISLSLLLFTSTVVWGNFLTQSKDPRTAQFSSGEEFHVANLIQENTNPNDIIFSSSSELSKRLSGIAFRPSSIGIYHPSIQSLYYGWINESTAIENSKVVISTATISRGTVAEYGGIDQYPASDRFYIYNEVNNLNISEDGSLELLMKYNVRIIVSQIIDGQIQTSITIVGIGSSFSSLLASISKLPPFYQGNELAMWILW